MNQRIATFLGFAQKAGKLAAGDSAAKAALHKGKGRLVVLSSDAAQRTARDFTYLAQELGVPLLTFGTKLEIGICIGQSPRSVVVIKDEGFAKTIIESFHVSEA